MDLLVFGLVAASAILHVTWNVLVKTSGDPLRAAGIGMAVGGLVLPPIAFARWLAVGQPAVPSEAIAIAVVSGALEALYVVVLAAAYRHGDLSIVYPLARGTATLLAVAIGIGILGERLGPLATLGLVALLVGFFALQRPWRAFRRVGGHRGGGIDRGVALALLCGVLIATYSAIDRVGTRLTEPLVYGAILWATTAVVIVLVIAARSSPAAVVPRDRRIVVGGLIMTTQYMAVLIALSLAPLTAVAPLRESAVVLATSWGALRLGEAAHRREAFWRIGAAALIVVGAVLLALER
ncbi:MAG TPA: GRP family sugar transporter [Candidatus Limnocylindrales bacterium]